MSHPPSVLEEASSLLTWMGIARRTGTTRSCWRRQRLKKRRPGVLPHGEAPKELESLGRPEGAQQNTVQRRVAASTKRFVLPNESERLKILSKVLNIVHLKIILWCSLFLYLQCISIVHFHEMSHEKRLLSWHLCPPWGKTAHPRQVPCLGQVETDLSVIPVILFVQKKSSNRTWTRLQVVLRIYFIVHDYPRSIW